MLSLHNQIQISHRNRHPSLKKQQGVVIVVALFIVALVATISYVMLIRLQRDTERTSLIVRNVQADLYAQGSLAWAIDVLRNNLEKKKQNQRVDFLPIQSPVDKVNGFRIASTIYDMQARYNLNLLAKPENQGNFQRLIRAVLPKFTEENAQTVARAVADWVNTKNAGQSEYDRYYNERNPPYRAAHRLMVNGSELRLVKGMTTELFVALQPYVTALPAEANFNILTARPEVLMTLNANLTLSNAKTLQEAISRAAIISKEALANLDLVKNYNISLDQVTLTSSYFLVETTVSIEDQVLLLYTLLERSENNGRAVLRIVWQSKGIW